MSIEEQFNAAVQVIQSLPKDGFFQPSNEMRLKFYAYFKQATEGPNTTKKPAFYNIVDRYKWEAWKNCGDMPKEKAMKLYVEELKKVIETISLTHEVSQFLNVLGPFYEFLPDEVANNNNNNSTNNKNQNQAVDKMNQNDDDQGDNRVTTTTTNEQNPGFTSYDSDGDEFADTIDTTLPSENDVPPTVFRNTFDDPIQSSHQGHRALSTSQNINHDENRFRKEYLISTNSNYNNNQHENSNDGNYNNNNNSQIDSNYNDHNNPAFGFNEQLAVAIFRLQHSIDRISNRIHLIESRQSADVVNDGDNHSKKNPKNHWPFKELSPKTTICLFTWPLVIFLLMNYLKRFRKK